MRKNHGAQNDCRSGVGAAATLIVLPVSIFAFFVRKSIVQGLTMGALKD
jgi:ABC-type glycerol-3-phosphate transport system permease component